MRCFFAYLAGFEIVGSIVSSVVKYECKGSWNRKPSLSSSPNDHDITVALHISTAAKVRKGIAKLRRTCAYTQPRDAPIHLHARSSGRDTKLSPLGMEWLFFARQPSS